MPWVREKKNNGLFFNLKNGIKNIIERSCQQLRNFVLKNEKVRYSIFIGNTNKCFYFYNGTLYEVWIKKLFRLFEYFFWIFSKINFCGQLKNLLLFCWYRCELEKECIVFTNISNLSTCLMLIWFNKSNISIYIDKPFFRNLLVWFMVL